MGWAGGSSMMSASINAFNASFKSSGLLEGEIVIFWRKMIDVFKNEDWDTQEDCIGLDRLWDKAFFDAHPYDSGYHAQAGDLNPYQEGCEDFDRWNAGYADGQEDR